MFNFTEVHFDKLAIHYVGNKHLEENFKLSKTTLQTDEAVLEMLKTFFFKPFKEDSFYCFSHETDLNKNLIFDLCTQLFEQPQKLLEISGKMAEFLYENSIHQKIKGGEFYVTFFKNAVVHEELADAIGLFKSENKETYLKVFQKNENFTVEHENGININKLDKGCLIFNTEKELGYKIAIVDTQNKGNEALYWKHDFLQLKPRDDNFYQTKNYMKLCKGFVEEVYNQENNISKPEQAEMLNKSLNFFKEKETFNQNEFEEEVVGNEEVAKAFKQYKQQYEEEFDVNLNDNFEISQNAVKKEKQKFKSVIKLDKNFHVYIHGDRERIIKGFDQNTKMNYYQLFYEEEN